MASLEYSKKVYRHFTNPKFAGKIENADAIGEVRSSICGDTTKIYLKIERNKKGEDFIKDIKFQTLGCCAAIASADMLCSIAKGKTMKEASKIKNSDIIKKLGGLPSAKIHCSVLGEETLQSAINDYGNKTQKFKE